MRPRTRLTTKLKSKRAGLPERVSRVELVTTQGRWWVDVHGNWHDVSKIDASYRENLARWLERKAKIFHFLDAFGLVGAYPLYWDDIAQDVYVDATEWMEQQPLYRALTS